MRTSIAIDPVCRISKALSAIFLAPTKSASSLSFPTAQRGRIGNLWDIARKMFRMSHYGAMIAPLHQYLLITITPRGLSVPLS